MPQRFSSPWHILKSFLLAFTIATIASDMSRYVDDLAVLYSIIGRNAIELTAFAIFCHNLVARPFAGIPEWLHVSGSRYTTYYFSFSSTVFLNQEAISFSPSSLSKPSSFSSAFPRYSRHFARCSLLRSLNTAS